MNTKKITLALIILLAGFFSGLAQSTSQTSIDRGTLLRVKPPQKRRAPSNVFLEYILTGNGISILPSEHYVTLDVIVTGITTEESWTGILSEKEGYYIETGLIPPGTYSISAVTEIGIQFYGEFEIED